MLWLLSVNKIFIYHPQFFPTALKCPKIAGAKTPIAHMLNAPLQAQADFLFFVLLENWSHHNFLSRFANLPNITTNSEKKTKDENMGKKLWKLANILNGWSHATFVSLFYLLATRIKLIHKIYYLIFYLIYVICILAIFDNTEPAEGLKLQRSLTPTSNPNSMWIFLNYKMIDI